MLIKHAKSFRLKSTGVKTAAALGLLLAATPMVAHSSNITYRTYSVKFERSLTENTEGIAKVYAMIEEKAKKACRFGTAVDDNGNEMSKSECISDMVEQLVENADIDAVTAYHLEMTTTG